MPFVSEGQVDIGWGRTAYGALKGAASDVFERQQGLLALWDGYTRHGPIFELAAAGTSIFRWSGELRNSHFRVVFRDAKRFKYQTRHSVGVWIVLQGGVVFLPGYRDIKPVARDLIDGKDVVYRSVHLETPTGHEVLALHSELGRLVTVLKGPWSNRTERGSSSGKAV